MTGNRLTRGFREPLLFLGRTEENVKLFRAPFAGVLLKMARGTTGL